MPPSIQRPFLSGGCDSDPTAEQEECDEGATTGVMKDHNLEGNDGERALSDDDEGSEVDESNTSRDLLDSIEGRFDAAASSVEDLCDAFETSALVDDSCFRTRGDNGSEGDSSLGITFIFVPKSFSAHTGLKLVRKRLARDSPAGEVPRPHYWERHPRHPLPRVQSRLEARGGERPRDASRRRTL